MRTGQDAVFDSFGLGCRYGILALVLALGLARLSSAQVNSLLLLLFFAFFNLFIKCDACLAGDGGCDIGLAAFGRTPHTLLGLCHRMEGLPDRHQVEDQLAFTNSLRRSLLKNVPSAGSSICCG